MFQIATDSFLIVLREGLEALLVIAALAAFLRRAGEGARVRALGWGAGAALLASGGMAWVFARYFGGNHDDLTEAVVMAVAALLLFYASGWMWMRQNPAAWTSYLSSQTSRALAADGPWALAVIAFLAVFREGAETILFLAAILGDEKGSVTGSAVALTGGIAAAALALAVIYLLMTRLALRLPLKPVFVATSAFLFILGLRLVGGAMQELQETGLVPFDDASLPGWLEALGLNPSWEALGLQAVLVLTALLTAVTLRQRGAAAARAR